MLNFFTPHAAGNLQSESLKLQLILPHVSSDVHFLDWQLHWGSSAEITYVTYQKPNQVKVT